MEKIEEAWKIVKLSGKIIWKQPFLLGYMAISFLSISLVVLGAVYPVGRKVWAKAPVGHMLEPYVSIVPEKIPSNPVTHPLRRIHPHWTPIFLTALSVYLPGTFIALFFNVAFLACVRRALNSQETSFFYGIRSAWERRWNIFQWAMVSATVGIALEFIGYCIQKLNYRFTHWIARWSAYRLLGFTKISWALATFLVVPVIVVEGGSPIQVLRRSATLFSKTWGQALVAGAGAAVFGFLAWVFIGLLPSFLVLQYSDRLFWSDIGSIVGGWFPVSVLWIGVLWIPLSLLPILFVGSVMAMVFRMALYVYAVEGVIPEEYKDEHSSWFVGHD